ncbi:MAG TPA: GDSL-type esterase/lipase family protein [Phycisphaerae bacterium]|nr:DUF4815 domain-containing protein [Phycisphaerae bacterium]HOI55833.1 GDSL-type esterase/lipase family protein [Phycisphaerae bacterium]
MNRTALWSMAMVACVVASAAAKPLTPAQVKLSGMKVTIVPAGQTVDIAPLEVKTQEHVMALAAGEPSWRTTPLLPGVAWICGAMTPGSLVVTLADDPSTVLTEGKDYKVNYNWGAVTGIEGGRSPAGAKVQCKYTYTLSRIDLIERTADGKVTVKQGTPDRGRPLLPDVTPGCLPLASVYLAPNTTTLTMANINLIDPDYDGVPPVIGAEHLAATRARLREGKAVTIVFLGDSITAQQPKDFRDGKGSFVDRFTAYLKELYADREVTVTDKATVVEPKDGQIVIVKAGIGGNDSGQGLKRLDTDVLAHRPHAVIVMFGVNDENKGRTARNNVPPEQYGKNLTAIVEKVRSAGAETVLMTTSMKMLPWEGTAGNLDEYAATARRVAADRKACLVDNFKAWEDLPRRGYNYAVFLGTCINHPVDLGHDLFFRGLKAAFEHP